MQNKPDCGCDNHLTSMFDHKDDNSSQNDLSKITNIEKLNEFTPKASIDLTLINTLHVNSFTEYNSPLSESFLDAPFHPPVA